MCSVFKLFRCWILFVISVLVCLQSFSAPAAGTDSSAEKPVKESSGITRTEKDVPVPQPKPDQQISNRIKNILELTGWFKDLKVASQEGVVTLSGEVAVASQRDWALDLAKDADGVVAVINKITLAEVGWFDLTASKNELKTLWRKFFAFIPHLAIGLVILAIAVVLYRYGARFNRSFWHERVENPVLSDVVSKLGALPILLVGLYLFLQVLGLTGLAFTLLGGTGALGLVAGFAFKNILENYFSGVMLSLRKPFVVGDMIEVAGEKGVVFKMTTRGTTLIDADGKYILIPNTAIFTGIIRNQSIGKATRINMSIESDPENLALDKESLSQFFRSRPEIVKSPEMTLLIGGTEEKPTVEVSFWVDPKVTDPESLKKSLLSEIRSQELGGHIKGASLSSTACDSRAVIERASKNTPLDPTERHL